ncbi:hybrid sensor histidine kinase/response regulator [Variovorax sp. NFACC27]|uniref:histidine kinase n=1 Tax=Variovorax gossypii TaxID=1679495 RepID=A0A3S0JRW1_9BURK|nr:hybrid sensor histidine kinase/response regulator [Variovorax gossypii]SEF26069.1 Signal transduction histidine kinase [Variovorax sp. NFACC28]SEG52085.1 Signal transduction histidine kinase [Variovorax sp. NFACC29]SFC18159.1 Signal transduction histidine kinase [Variovorax sp. NFACC26]SFH00477.1 Signal transduction histidine kinase [Variovorax sp. NFACC27]RTQ31108.1 hybrid sensor histidine kinase/response regulator [Variovorax gossypii]
MTPTPASPPAPSPAGNGSDSFAIQCEVLRLSIKPIGPVLLVQYLLNCGVAALFAWQFSLVRALAWIALITGVTAMRGFFPQRLPEPFTPASLREAQRTHTLRTAVWELAHGLAGVLLFNPARVDLQLLLGVIIMGMTLSSAFSVSFYTPATQLAITLLLAPIIVTGLWLGAPVMAAVAVIGIGLTAMMWKLVAERSRQLEENIGLRLNEHSLREQALAGLRASEQAQAERLRFFSAANHDLRQPVMAIGLQAEVLRHQLDDGASMEAVQHTVGSLARAQQALEGLTNQLLEIGRIEAAVDPLRPTTVALAPLLQELARQAGNGRVLVRCPPGAIAWSDTVSLRRVLANLVDNAVKFTPRGRVLLAVRARRRDGARAWRVEVRDRGIGIPPEAQQRVFDDFEQIGNVERNLQRGHGLGLAIVRRLATQLGIEVSLRSAPGRGSVFGFELPAAPEGAQATAQQPTAPAAKDEGAGATSTLRPGLAVLVVEDNAVVADSLAALLRQWEVEPRVYASAAEALALADLHALDAALCDIRLPGALDGIALAAKLQQQKPSLAIALISADITEATQRLAAEQGWRALRKPVQPEELRRMLLGVQQARG